MIASQIVKGSCILNFTYVHTFFCPSVACMLDGKYIETNQECSCSYDGNLHCPENRCQS